jgi:hypothetical protein
MEILVTSEHERRGATSGRQEAGFRPWVRVKLPNIKPSGLLERTEELC